MKKIVSCVLVMILSMSLVSCGGNDNREKTSETVVEEASSHEVYVEMSQVNTLFPAIKDIVETHYIVEPLGIQNGRVVGPTDYRYVGVIKLSDSYSKELAEKYTYTNASIYIEKDLQEFAVGDKWMYSADLCKELKPEYYGGKIYLNGNLMYFDISTN